MSETAWTVVAFTAVAVGIGLYLASISLRRRNLSKRLAQAGARRRAGSR